MPAFGKSWRGVCGFSACSEVKTEKDCHINAGAKLVTMLAQSYCNRDRIHCTLYLLPAGGDKVQAYNTKRQEKNTPCASLMDFSHDDTVLFAY
jgi:hypothetical protein